MNPSTRSRIQLFAVAGTMILTLGAGSMSLTGLRGGLEVQGVTVQADGVAIVVANLSGGALSGTVVVRGSSDMEFVAAVPVSVPAGARTTVYLGLPAPIAGGVTVGIVLDDGAPF